MTVMYPIFWLVWGILYAPVRLILGLSDFVGFVCNYIYELVRDVWLIVSGIFKLASNAEATVNTYEVSIWRSLWNDLFSQVDWNLKLLSFSFLSICFFRALYAVSVLTVFILFQVFRAVRSILNGFVAFFAACNRHRLRLDCLFICDSMLRCRVGNFNLFTQEWVDSVYVYL